MGPSIRDKEIYSAKIEPTLVLAALEGAVAQGVEVETLLAKVGSSRRDLLLGEGITPSQFSGLLRSLWDRMDDESSGFAWRPLRVGGFRMMCHATVGCLNLRRALLRVCDFFSLLSDEYQWRLEEQGEEACFVLGGEQEAKRAFLLLTLCVILHRWASWMIDRTIPLDRVDLPFAADRFDVELAPLLRSEIRFDSPVTRLWLPRHLLNQPVRQNAESLATFLADSPERLLSLYRADDSLSHRVRRHLEQCGCGDGVTQESVAAHFNISVATLGRRLKQEGYPFQQLKDRVRRARAVRLLLGSEMAIGDIALALGYSEASVFYRSFRRWWGVTPAEFREQHR